MKAFIAVLFLSIAWTSSLAVDRSPAPRSILNIAKENEFGIKPKKGVDVAHFCRVRRADEKAIELRTADDIKKIKHGQYYALKANIKLPYGFPPLGQIDEPIRDILLEGNGHKIEGLSQPLFIALSDSTIKNLTLTDIYIGGDNAYGGTLAKNVGSNTCLQNIRVADGWIQASARLGGVVGVLHGTNFFLDQIDSTLDVKARGGLSESFGGIVGEIKLSTMGRIQLSRLSSQGKILAPDAVAVGGLIGSLHVQSPRSTVEFTDSEFRGVVKGASKVGGLIGWVQSTSKQAHVFIERNFTQAHVSGKSWEDPAVADFSTPSAYIGGLIGDMGFGKVRHCFTQGYVSGRTRVGGFVGGASEPNCAADRCGITQTYTATQIATETLQFHPDAPRMKTHSLGGFSGEKLPYQVEKSYWDKKVAQVPSSPNGQAKPTEGFRQITMFASSLWEFVPRQAYPKLARR